MTNARCYVLLRPSLKTHKHAIANYFLTANRAIIVRNVVWLGLGFRSVLQ